MKLDENHNGIEKASLSTESKDTQINSIEDCLSWSDEDFEPRKKLDAELIKKEVSEKLKGKNPFPVEVFPDDYQKIIKETNKHLNFPVDFISASMLYSTSVAIGNTYNVELSPGFISSAVIFIVLVGRPGTSKTHPLNFALSPIAKRDNKSFKEYEKREKEFEEYNELTKKEKKQVDEVQRPFWKQTLVSDFTIESISSILLNNNRGVGLDVDELAIWFKNFNRYNQGSEQEFWLANWNSNRIVVNRKTAKPINIPNPFVSVGGTIQPAVLDELAKNRTDNGFLDRLLFVMPENLKKQPWSAGQLPPETPAMWEDIISKLLNIQLNTDEDGNPVPKTIRFSEDAKEYLLNWQKESTEIANTLESDAEVSIYSKLETYALRLSLILELMKYSCNESELQSVSLESVEGGIKLIDYFKNNALKVHSIISNPLDKLPLKKRELFKELPEEFTTAQGLSIASEFEVPDRTFNRLLKDRDLFVKVETGLYRKTI